VDNPAQSSSDTTPSRELQTSGSRKVSEDEFRRRQEMLKELLAQPQAEKQEIRLALEHLAQKALLICVLFGVCALLASSDTDKGTVLVLFLVAAGVVLFWPFPRNRS